MKSCSNYYLLFGLALLTAGLTGGLVAVNGAKATAYNTISATPTLVVELVPANKGLPIRIITNRPLRSL